MTMEERKKVSLLDVTLRDGSYAIDYQYTAEQAARIVSALHEAGIDYIELGHGCGIGAGENLGYKAAASDGEYVRAARQAAPGARIGVIAGAPPTTLPKDIDSVIDTVDFIRFAANCDNPRVVESNILHARNRRPDLLIFFQMMRSNRLSPDRLLESAHYVQSLGVKTVYIVDTAGHFIPEEISAVVSLLTGELSLNVGFHGHNNLGLAVANTLAAIDAGATFVDASLKGMGRGAGNAILESVVSILLRKGIIRGINFDLLVHAGRELIAPIMPPRKGIDHLDLFTADANIDLYPEKTFRQLADSVGLDFTQFIRMLAADSRLVEPGQREIQRVLLNNVAQLRPKPAQKPPKKKFLIRKKSAGRTAVIALKSHIPELECPEELIGEVIDRFPDTRFYSTRYDPGTIEHLEEAEVLFAHSLTPSILSGAPCLRWFHSVVTGPDLFAFPELMARNITVTTPRGAYSVPIAETVIGLTLSLTRKIHTCHAWQAKRKWAKLQIMAEDAPMAGELKGSTAAIIGLGGIGSEVARRCKCLEMNVIAVVPTLRTRPDYVDTLVVGDDLDRTVSSADFLIICCPLTKQTRGLIDARRLSLMKRSAYLINVARGAIVDETALLESLRAGDIGGAALDVFTEEPLPDNHAFFTLPNVIVCPRVAGWSSTTWKRSIERFCENYERFLRNEPLIGVVDFRRGY